MFSADSNFSKISHHLPPYSWKRAKVQFRRALREYVVFKGARMRKYGPNNGQKKIFLAERIVFTGGRFRRIKKYQQPAWQSRGKGRRPNLPLEFLVARLAFIWAVTRSQRTSISHKGNQKTPTPYEVFMKDCLGLVGVYSVRKYLERHSALKRRL
jgi:hypothetical protein